jgi:hypothetical protein
MDNPQCSTLQQHSVVVVVALGEQAIQVIPVRLRAARLEQTEQHGDLQHNQLLLHWPGALVLETTAAVAIIQGHFYLLVEAEAPAPPDPMAAVKAALGGRAELTAFLVPPTSGVVVAVAEYGTAMVVAPAGQVVAVAQ